MPAPVPSIRSVDGIDPAQRPLWSIMIPVHNCARHLRSTLEGVVDEVGDRADVAVVVVDDCSDDDPAGVISSISVPYVRYVRHDVRHGAVENFNACLSLSTGYYVHLLHGDDGVLPGFYHAFESVLENPRCRSAFCRTQYIDEHGSPLATTRSERTGSGEWLDAVAALSVSNRVRPASFAARRSVYEAVGGFRPDLPHTADWEMWTRIASRGPMWFIDETLAVYRRHETSDSSARVTTGSNVRERIEAIDVISAELRDRGHRPRRIRALGYSAAFAVRSAFGFLARRRVGTGLAQLRAAGECVVAMVR